MAAFSADQDRNNGARRAPRHGGRIFAYSAAVIATALIAAGCSSGSSSSGGSTSSPAGSGASSSGRGIKVIATETEFHIARLKHRQEDGGDDFAGGWFDALDL